MFGFSFGEILVIAIIAVLFLGPDKLPQTFIDIARFIKALKKTINDAKDAIDREVHISEIKQEALEYKKKFEQSTNDITKDISNNKSLNELSDILNSSLEVPSYNSTSKNDAKDEVKMQDLESKGKEIASKVNLKKKEVTNKADSTKQSDAEQNNV
ncbi:Sec-independent protein translocase protein TatB [Helicobacter sp. MIT 99-5507]|uniref:Sec-independent protein translocase protein TatB n=1 Tax=Helicobacter sp. MIT 99-5507 TaxID=152489 RepID=UPI000E1E8B45|nr:Sec-independent protein translocase protein TatB [Helicobacter sp. MIT 99-5507]RDU57495.1 hypothetical protein CQA42_06130 [Helicobacter sp. MIT 99-5507]